MTNPDYDRPVPLQDLAKHFSQFHPGPDRLPFAVIFRWAMKGVRGAKLETVKIDGKLCASPCSVVEFLRRTKAGRRERATAALRRSLWLRRMANRTFSTSREPPEA